MQPFILLIDTHVFYQEYSSPLPNVNLCKRGFLYWSVPELPKGMSFNLQMEIS